MGGVDMKFIKQVLQPIILKSVWINIGNNAKISLKENKNIKVRKFNPYKYDDFVGKEISSTPLAFEYLGEEPFYLTKRPWGQPFTGLRKPV